MQRWSRSGVLRSPAVRGALYYFGFWGAVGTYIPFLYVYFKEIGLSGSQIGVFATLVPLCMLTVAPLVANLADRWRARVRILSLCIALLGCALALLGLTQTYWILLVLMLLMSLVRSPIAGIGDGLVAKMAVEHGLHFGSLRLWGSLGFAGVAIISGMMWQRIGYHAMFGVSGVAFLIVAGLAFLLDEETMTAPAGPTWGPLLRDPGMRTILITAFLLVGSLSMSGTFEGILMAGLGGGGVYIGLLLGVTGLSEIPVMRNASRLTARLGSAGSLLLGCCILATAHAAYALAWSPPVLLAAAMLRGAGFGLSFVMMVSIVSKRAPAGMVASAQAALSGVGWGLAPLIGIPISGILYDNTGGAQSVFWVCSVLAVASALVLWYGIAARVFEEQ